ncbi:DUF1822 family protein [Cyanobacteria bacterium FACHB-63]|nr:DUF1822 family protein [Cyanobacteria bacterium FACHB-63]
MNSIEAMYTTIPLGETAHSQARQFAAEQSTPQKGKRTYLNTLAVYAVHEYLKWMQIDTDLTQADSWQSAKRALFDVADLLLPNLGRLECRPILAGETTVALPLEATQDRFGYVAVEFGEHLNEARLLGFIRAIDVPDSAESIAIAQFQSIDTLLDCLPEVTVQPVVNPDKTQVNLTQWLQNIFEVGWQSLEALLGSNRQAAFSLRNRLQPTETTVQRAKLIDLGLQLGHQPMILLVAISAASNSEELDTQERGPEPEAEILVQVHPVPEEPYLPSNLQLHLLSETGERLQTVRSREYDNYIQLSRFQGTPGESFDLQLILGRNSLTESFVI